MIHQGFDEEQASTSNTLYLPTHQTTTPFFPHTPLCFLVGNVDMPLESIELVPHHMGTAAAGELTKVTLQECHLIVKAVVRCRLC